MKPTLFAATLVSLASGACEPPEVPSAQAVATTSAALDSVYGPFSLTGKVRIGTSQCAGGAGRSVTLGAKFSDSAGLVQVTPISGAQDPADLARNYSASPQRDIESALVTYQWRNTANASIYGRFLFGGSVTAGTSRDIRYRPPDFIAPPSGTDTLVQDVTLANLASLQVEVETAWESTLDDVVRVTIQATAAGNPTSISYFNSANCSGDGRNESDTANCAALAVGATPSTVDSFIRRNLPAGGPVTSQRTAAELLLDPGRAYTITIRVEYRDGISSAISKTLSAAQVPECGTILMTPETDSDLSIGRSPQNLNVSFFLRSDEYITNPANGGPRPIGYYSTFSNLTTTSERVGYTAGGGLIFRTSGALAPYTYQWRGVSPGRYRMAKEGNLGAAGWVELGHVLLGWGSAGEPGYRPEFRAVIGDSGSGAAFRPLFRWPRVGAVPTGEVGTASLGLDASGHFYVDADETQSVNRFAAMSYIRGQVELLGCDVTQANIASGVAEMEGDGSATGPSYSDEKGTTRLSVTGNFEGFARGLFRAGSHVDAGEFEVAVSPGSWKQLGYRMRIAGIGPPKPDEPVYDGDLHVFPSSNATFTVGAGRAGENTALLLTPVQFQVTKVGVTMRVPAGQVMRNPTLQIGTDSSSFTGRVRFDNSSGVQLGTYLASSVLSTSGVAEVSPLILALSNSSVTIRPSAEISTDGGQSYGPLTSFPPVTVDLAGSCGVCVVDATTTIPDDGEGPAVQINAVPTQPSGTTSVTVTGTAVDLAVPVVALSVNGIAQPLAPSSASQAFAAQINGLVQGDNVVTVTARDCVGNSTTRTLTIVVAAPVEPLCAAQDTPSMCLVPNGQLSAPGSAFYVDLVGPAGELASVLCTVAASGAAPVCDTTNLLATQCGN